MDRASRRTVPLLDGQSKKENRPLAWVPLLGEDRTGLCLIVTKASGYVE